MRAIDFIRTARDLTGSSRGRPRESNLRRAVSTTYYALFHCLADCCANMLVGSMHSSRSQPAWRQTYRALRHSTVRNRCQRQDIIRRFPRFLRFPNEIESFARLFVDLQAKRHSADYDPTAHFLIPDGISDVIKDIDVAEVAINLFNAAPRLDRRAFAIYVLLDIRSS